MLTLFFLQTIFVRSRLASGAALLRAAFAFAISFLVLVYFTHFRFCCVRSMYFVIGVSSVWKLLIADCSVCVCVCACVCVCGCVARCWQFFPIVQKLLQNLVLEKERRTREGPFSLLCTVRELFPWCHAFIFCPLKACAKWA